MYQNSISEEYEEPEQFSNGREYLEHGFVPVGVQLNDKVIVFTEYLGDVTGAPANSFVLHEGIYLLKNDFVYSNGDWISTPYKVIYSW